MGDTITSIRIIDGTPNQGGTVWPEGALAGAPSVEGLTAYAAVTALADWAVEQAQGNSDYSLDSQITVMVETVDDDGDEDTETETRDVFEDRAAYDAALKARGKGVCMCAGCASNHVNDVHDRKHLVLVETVEPSQRGTAEAAGSWAGLSQRYRIHPDCLADMDAGEREWHREV